ncbi:hypothetical protein SKAU_G00016400 [Synaphobranchus kaupii]|uniref:Uncharacterized protein n=1 Tax=Synaphobranchus kaupii TaxID=118154 RepID=A0A9Q1JDV6_SYNKA|nr:hypothetical protein SKAU_G00016400 [Synaphobranchus kaupii]
MGPRRRISVSPLECAPVNTPDLEDPGESNDVKHRGRLQAPSLQERQKRLQEKHQRAKESLDRLAVGGGVSLWPEMDRMRLTAQEGVTLGLGCVTVSFSGSLLLSVHQYTLAVSGFSAAHPVYGDSQSALNHTLLTWHSHFLHLQDSIKKQFETQLLQTHGTYQLYLLLYIGAIGTLLYYLADNVIQKSCLTPRRIKMWVLLLVATATWTLLMLRLLVWYQRLESAIEEAVRRFQDELAHLATVDLDLRLYHNIATYWRGKCLPPLSRGDLYGPPSQGENSPPELRKETSH